MSMKDWSTTAASNATISSNSGINWQEGQAPSTVNDSARAMMADVRAWYEAAEWIDLGHAPTYASGTSFSVPGDKTAIYTVGRRVKIYNGSSTFYATISAVSYSTNTTVTVVNDGSALSGTLSTVAVGIVNPSNSSEIRTHSGVHTFSSNPILSGGTANGIAYLDGSKNLVSGSSLQFDGTNLGLAATPNAWGSTFRVLQLGSYGQHIGGQTNTADLKIGTNNYYNGSNYLYTNTGYVTAQIQVGINGFAINYAPAGTANSIITFTPVFGIAKDVSLALQGATSQSGTGITFPAAQSASSDSNTLDDYEEGSFTPTIKGLSNPTVSYDNTFTGGKYTKIGNLVYFVLEVRWNSLSGGSGDMYIDGLPFTRANYYGSDATPMTAEVYNVSFTGFDYVTASVSKNTTTVGFIKVRNGNTSSAVAVSDLPTGFGLMRCCGCYQATA